MAKELPQGVGAGAVPADRSAGRSGADRALRWASRRARILAPLLTLMAMIAFFSVASDRFLDVANFQNILTQVGRVAVAATGITFVLLCAEIDLSIASVATFAGVLSAYFWVGTWLELGNWGVLVGLLVGALIGLINGIFVSRVGIPSFMMTLAMLTIALGLSIYVTQGRPIFEAPTLLRFLGSSGERVLGIPVIAIVAAVVLLIGDFVLSFTRFGRYVYMTGGNREAAEMSGVDTRRVVMLCLMISGVTASLAGMLDVGRLSQANPAAGGDLLIATIAAVVLGGTSLFGGEGGIRNTVLGLLIFGVLSNGLNLLPDISIYIKQALQGVILVGALLLNVLALRLERVRTRAD
ncbi:MAG: ABC transporter permease [Chloroflexota bacterium]|nr:ABC transporter permease [Chloroflexota bacterium]